MKRIYVLTISAGIALILTGCALTSTKAVQVPEPEPDPRPLTLTTEEIQTDEFGDAIIVYFPKGAGKPVAFFNDETQQWAVGSRVNRTETTGDQ